MAEHAAAEYANIIIDISHDKLDKTFQYRIPETVKDEIQIGMQVLVPFGSSNRRIRGYVVELTTQPEYPVDKIKALIEIERDSVAIESQLIALAGWIRKNYGGTMNHALKTVLPVKKQTRPKLQREVVLLLSPQEAREQHGLFQKKHSTARARLLGELIEHKKLTYDLVTKKLNISPVVIRALEDMGILRIKSIPAYQGLFEGSKAEAEITLNMQQKAVIAAINEDLNQNRRQTYLLHGVTGSGKTAVYIALIEEIVRRGEQAIVLIPEIALTYQTLMRFYHRFQERVSVLNSKMSKGERYEQFMRARNGEIDVMIGPRSALFTPFTNLGFIIIDEEHESSYKSETQPRYHARETAIKRAEFSGAGVLLGSATPSVESYYKALKGEYRLLELKTRIDEKPMPVCDIIDLREELKNGNRSILSNRLQELMEERLQQKEQIMLFLNRRGISSFLSCRACGYVFQCPHCDVSLSQHNNNKMLCHYCGYSEPQRKNCPVCGSGYVSGFKAGTQKIEQIIKQRFPAARTLRMDYDTTRNKAGYQQILTAFSNREADILIGTQMIVKGHDFKNVTLVGVLAADLSLYANDFHAPERTFQLLTQAAGRAGRGDIPGEVVIQTYAPAHYSIQMSKNQDYKAFYDQEIIYRKLLSYPPVWNLLGILISSRDEMTAALSAEVLGKKMKVTKEKRQMNDMLIIGPADAPIAKVKDMYKKVLFVKHKNYSDLIQLKDAIEGFMEAQQGFKNVYIQFDFNPINVF